MSVSFCWHGHSRAPTRDGDARVEAYRMKKQFSNVCSRDPDKM